jgi:Lrp/AsnC family transcriptional regulator for asnA, asnC and gidA
MAAKVTNTLDQLDYNILNELRFDGRKSFTEIAQALNVSVGTVRNRVTRLVDDKQLYFLARTDPIKVGFCAPTSIHITIQPSNLIEAAAAQIAKFPEVTYLAMLTGDSDLEVDVMCRDLEHLSSLIADRLHKVPGVFSTRTYSILRVYKYAAPDMRLLSGDQKGRG